MSTDHPILAQLNESRRDALVQFYLGQIVPAEGTAAGQLVTPEDLYQYLLLDNQVSAKVTTSWVAEAIASLQQYIHSIYNGMEPGHLAAYEREEVERWRNWEARYSIWAANQLLQSYPENYIDPTLRIKKTEIFREFESKIGQARINSDRVRDAALDYLRRFEEVSNLQVMTGYIDGPSHQDADYYFVGREKIAPHRYYWRKARVQIEPDNTQLNPSVWDEWKLIDLAFSEEVTHIRPVRSGGRLYIVWVEKHLDVKKLEKDQEPSYEYDYVLKLAHLDLNGQWSVPMTVKTIAGQDNESFKLLAIAFESLASKSATLAVALTRTGEGGEAITLAWNAVFDRIELTSGQENLLKGLAVNRFDQAERLQNRFVSWESVFDGIEFEVESVRVNDNPAQEYGITWPPHQPPGGINQYLELQVECFNENKKAKSTYEVDFNVRGRCHAVREIRRIETLQVQLVLFSGILLKSVLEIRPNSWDSARPSRATFSISRILSGIAFDAELLYGESELPLAELSFAARDQGPKTYTFDLPENIEKDILKMSAQQIRDGASFSFRLKGVSQKTPLASSENRLVTYRQDFQSVPFKIWSRTGDKFENQKKLDQADTSLTLNGGAVTHTASVTTTSSPNWPYRHAFIFGVSKEDDPSYGYNWFDVTLKEKPQKGPCIIDTADGETFLNGAQFLVFNNDDLALKYVRLNTLFVGQLIQRASFSLERLLHWDTQHMEEPGTPDEPNKPVWMDFNGANGRYFWELFFHIPHLVAHQLTRELNYADAQDWLHYLFNPSAPVIPAEHATPSYWQVRPLMEEGDASYEIDGPTDPDAIAYSCPEHYCKKVYLDYVHNLIAWADALYRRLTRDSLSEAKLLYVRALSLMGNAPAFRGVSRWDPAKLVELSPSDATALNTFEVSLNSATLANLPLRPGGPVMLDLLDAPAFRLPLNQLLLDVWDTLAFRLNNLRQNLTIDGKPMHLPLFDAIANPRDLLRAQAAGAGFGQRNPGGHLVIPPYRFLAILPRAQNAIETLCRFGDQVRQLMELGDRSQQEELQQRHLIEMADFAERLQQDYVEHAEATKASLQANQATLELRVAYYRELVEQDVSPAETAALVMTNLSQTLQAATSAISAAGAAASLVPNVFGLANGGSQYGAPFQAVAYGLSAQSSVAQIVASNLEISDRYRRRRVEWEHQRDLAEKEVEALQAQITAQDAQIQAAQTALAQQGRARTQAEELYAFLSQTRGSKVSLYRWLHSQMATLYFQAYDAVTALCLSVQACWQYEIGDYDTHFIQPDVWFDNYHGLTAGEAMKLALLKMESAFVHRNERKLELTKTVSLREHPDIDWDDAVGKLNESGQLPFALTAKMLDEDHPGLYLRQLLSVSVTIPAVIGPYQNINARLLQVSSQTVIKPDIAAVRYTHNPEDKEANSTHVRFNLRPTGQIALSSGLDDKGMLQMNFDDGRYLPFEGTGAISQWMLEFPRPTSMPQKDLFESMTDIIIQFHYTAVDGGRDFAKLVEPLVPVPEPTPTPTH
ncbi:neuraminidase-like domain-containing protein [Mycoavidus sp. SF9855]|uniref:Tc toxin subunit A-related protein n=1 Tax=Mycoavidus sp. SF9855 TaxID=2968475 RepID=UPI00211C0FBD|nr:neuraminidase-like domain-containing protein [Mycoavidus sp. SF9855]UUM22273.1 neuraminidase-like domain-containing protein [Mycoavidus sp. SF9855]